MTTEMTTTNGELVRSDQESALDQVLFTPRKLIYRSMRGQEDDQVDALARTVTGEQRSIWDDAPIELHAIHAVVMSGEETNPETGEVGIKTRLYLVDDKQQCWVTTSGPAISDFFTLVQLKGEPCPAKPIKTKWLPVKCRNGRKRLSCTLPGPSPATLEATTPAATDQAGESASIPTSTRSKQRAGSSISG